MFFNYRGTPCFLCRGTKQPCREGTISSVHLLRAARWHGDIIWG